MARLSTISGPVQRYMFLFSNLTIPNFQKALLHTLQTETQRRLTVTSIALRRYQKRHGTFPENLNALILHYLFALPRDDMSGKTLCYRLKPDGIPLLYSAGVDGADDGGDPTASKPVTSGSLWTGHAAVWPEASSSP